MRETTDALALTVGWADAPVAGANGDGPILAPASKPGAPRLTPRGDRELSTSDTDRASSLPSPCGPGVNRRALDGLGLAARKSSSSSALSCGGVTVRARWTSLGLADARIAVGGSEPRRMPALRWGECGDAGAGMDGLLGDLENEVRAAAAPSRSGTLLANDGSDVDSGRVMIGDGIEANRRCRIPLAGTGGGPMLGDPSARRTTWPGGERVAATSIVLPNRSPGAVLPRWRFDGRANPSASLSSMGENAARPGRLSSEGERRLS